MQKKFLRTLTVIVTCTISTFFLQPAHAGWEEEFDERGRAIRLHLRDNHNSEGGFIICTLEKFIERCDERNGGHLSYALSRLDDNPFSVESWECEDCKSKTIYTLSLIKIDYAVENDRSLKMAAIKRLAAEVKHETENKPNTITCSVQ